MVKEGKPEKLYADSVQLAYAKTLEFVSHAIIIVMALGFILYIFRLLPLTVPVETVAANWHLNATKLQMKIHHHSGWSCFEDVHTFMHGDTISYASVVFLSMATMVCLATATIAFFKEKNRIYLLITILQVLMLLVAASGKLTSGH
ncbi:MAG: DUF1634 domain-containing protein [Chlorobaculum sp.]